MSGTDVPGVAAMSSRDVSRLRLASVGLATLLVAAVPSLRAGEVVAPWQVGAPAPQTSER